MWSSTLCLGNAGGSYRQTLIDFGRPKSQLRILWRWQNFYQSCTKDRYFIPQISTKSFKRFVCSSLQPLVNFRNRWWTLIDFGCANPKLRILWLRQKFYYSCTKVRSSIPQNFNKIVQEVCHWATLSTSFDQLWLSN